MTAGALGDLKAGDQLGHLEYLIDDGTLAAYRGLVGRGGHYPNLLADDCRTLLRQRCGPMPLTTDRRAWEFMRPPVPGRRIQVGGWLREINHSDALPRLRVAAFAVDEIGTEIMRSEAIFRVQQCLEHDRSEGDAPAAVRATDYGGTLPAGVNLDGISRGDAIALGTLVLPDGENLTAGRRLSSCQAGLDLNDDGYDLTAVTGGWLEAGIGQWFGDDFRWGGRMSLRRRCPVNAGDVLTGTAVIIARNADDAGAIAWRLAISATNERYRPGIVGKAIITTPSPRTL